MFVQEDFRQAVDRTKDVLEQLIKAQPNIKTHIKVLAHFYTLWGFLTLETDEEFEPGGFAPVYLEFMDKVTAAIKASGSEEEQTQLEDEVRIYAANSRGASTDLTPRQSRHDQLTLAMAGFTGAVHEDS